MSAARARARIIATIRSPQWVVDSFLNLCISPDRGPAKRRMPTFTGPASRIVVRQSRYTWRLGWEKGKRQDERRRGITLILAFSLSPSRAPRRALPAAPRRHVHACVHACTAARRARTRGVVERAGGTEDNSNDCTNPLAPTLYKSRARTALGNNGPQRV